MDIIGRKMKETEGESGKKPAHHRLTGNSKYNKNKSYGLIDYKDRVILDWNELAAFANRKLKTTNNKLLIINLN